MEAKTGLLVFVLLLFLITPGLSHADHEHDSDNISGAEDQEVENSPMQEVDYSRPGAIFVFMFVLLSCTGYLYGLHKYREKGKEN